MQFENCYTSVNSNQTPSVVSWGQNNVICYGACNAVMVYDPFLGSGGKITHTLVEHSKRVNSVKWLAGKDTTFETELISGSTDFLVIVWSLKEGQYFSSILKGHQSNVNIVDGLYKGANKHGAVVVSASMDCTVKIWYRPSETEQFFLTQEINFGYNISVGLKVSYSPNDILVLACALDNSKIGIYVEVKNDKLHFHSSAQLVGHEDWVRGLDFTLTGSDLLLASCSQDTFIRLWRFTKTPLIASDTYKSDNTSRITIGDEIYYFYLESVLTGHEGWIYSVNWAPNSLQLLSASIDKTMIIWEFAEDSGLWTEKVRVGEVGGNTLGFYGGVFGRDGNQILGYSYHGAFHIWTNIDETGGWQPTVSLGGHFSEVVDCAWEPKGEFLISVSADQTTRIHAPWPNNKEPVTWHEIARPQVHGYDLSSLGVLSRYKFASSAEEKVIRIFEAPKNFIDNFKRICKINDDEDSSSKSNQLVPKGASVPSLGLSNKAIFTDDNLTEATSVDKKNPYPEESYFVATEMTEPPTEETLLQNTLWPEIQKLYGHGYEVYSLAASPDGKFLASACKSTQPEHAAVLIWDTDNWKLIQKLLSHTLTVVQLQFSPDSKCLLSVSRDRRWSLFAKNNNGLFELIGTSNRATGIHTRIIWTCCWSHDSKYFLTGSRDGKAVAWTINKEKERKDVLGQCEAASTVLELKNESVTAVAFAPSLIHEAYLTAIGLESGVIFLYKWSPGPEQWKKVLLISRSFGHHLTVKRLCFRPVYGKAGDMKKDENILQLASCSSDYSVRVYNIFVNTLE